MRIDRSLWIALIFSFLITSLPSIAGMFNAPAGGEWTGLLTRNTADVNGYLSMIEEVRQGSIRTHNLFTSEPHPAFQIRPLWIVLGCLGRFFPGISTEHLMEIGRFVSSFCLLLCIAILTTRLFTTSKQRLIGFLVLVFGAGIGWTNLIVDPPDIRIVETSTFLTLVSPPLYSTSLSLILIIILCVDRLWNSDDKLRASLLGACAALWLGFDRPFSVATIGIAIAGLVIASAAHQKRIEWRNVTALMPIAFGALVAIVYQAWAIRNVPVYAEWNRQHILPTPPWSNLAIALGLLIPLAVFGIRPMFERHRTIGFLAASFIAGSLILSHISWGFQERFLEGLPIMTAVFSAAGLHQMAARLNLRSVQTAFITTLLVVVSISDFFPLRRDLVAIASQSPPQYVPKKFLDPMRSLATLARPGEAVLSAEATGNFLIAYSGRPAVIAHKIATARYFEKGKLVMQYLRTPPNTALSKTLFDASLAKWLFWGPEEANLSHGIFDPEKAPYLTKQYDNGFVRIFKLK